MPISIEGDKEESKKAQKKLKKKKTSERINRSIPIRKHNSNLCVWKPIILSRTKSFHQRRVNKNTTIKENKTYENLTLKLIQRTTLKSIEKTPIDKTRGQKEVWTARKGEVNI